MHVQTHAYIDPHNSITLHIFITALTIANRNQFSSNAIQPKRIFNFLNVFQTILTSPQRPTASF